jgi:hypothetical protein
VDNSLKKEKNLAPKIKDKEIKIRGQSSWEDFGC